MTSKKHDSCLFHFRTLCFLFFLLLSFSHLHAEVSKEQTAKILADYEQALQLAEKLDLRHADPLVVLPEIKQASELILQEKILESEPIIESALARMKIYETKKPFFHTEKSRALWLELVWEVIQKFGWIALLAYVLSRFRRFRSLVQSDVKPINDQMIFGFVFLAFGGLMMIKDLAGYGTSSWIFFDLQLALTLLSGWIGGLGMMAVLGVGFLAQRFWFSQDISAYGLIYFGSFIFAAVLVRKKSEVFYNNTKPIMIGGLFSGLLSGAVYLFPMKSWIEPWVMISSLGSLMMLEGLAVLSFYFPISQTLKEEARQKQEEEFWKTRLLFLRSQMNPHFVFNALSTIAVLCDKEKASQSRKLILHLSDFLRQMARKEDDQISLREETDYVEAYLEIEQARFGDRLKIQRNFLISDHFWDYQIPVLMIQTLVENAVKHGISPKAQGGRIAMTYRERNERLEIVIEDDGEGFDQRLQAKVLQNKMTKPESGIGIKNLEERLSRLYGKDYQFKLESEPGRGTQVTVQVPLLKH